jgi:hypothetical protein
VAQLFSLGHNMRVLTFLFVILYWAVCTGFYFVAALAFVRVMASLVRVPKGWIRNSLWLLLFTPVRGALILFPYIFGIIKILPNPEPDRLMLVIFVSLCFAASLIPAAIYWRKHRDIVYGVIRQ